jgi:hypothetical protein
MWRTSQGAFRDDPKTSAGAKWLIESGTALAADAIVVSTGADLTPGPRDRERLARWAGHLLSRSQRPVVWQPGGLWESEDAEALATSLGLVCAFDPLEGPAPAGPIAYARVRALGARARLGDGLLRSVVDVLSEASAETVYLAIEAEDAVRKARRTSDILEALAAGGGGGQLRRAGGLVVDLGDEDDDDADDADDADDDDADDDDADDDDADDADDDDADDADDDDADDDDADDDDADDDADDDDADDDADDADDAG